MNKAGDLFTFKNFQLLGITALWIACKFEEVIYPYFDLLIKTCDNFIVPQIPYCLEWFVKKQLIDMEASLMKIINFRFYTCYRLRFLELYRYMFEMDLQEYLFCKHCLETTLMDERFYEYHFSTVTLSVIFSFFRIHSNNAERKKMIYKKIIVLVEGREAEFGICLNKMVGHWNTWVVENESIFTTRYLDDCDRAKVTSIYILRD